MGTEYNKEVLQYYQEQLKALEDFELCLVKSDFTNAWDISKATLEAIEATFTGYARITLTGGTVQQTPGEDKEELVYGSQTFTRGSGGSGDNIFGHWIMQKAAPYRIIVCEKYGAPILMDTAGYTHSLTPKLRVYTKIPCP